jgi:hypothetical protein
MKPHKAEEVSPEDWALFRQMRFVVENLPEKLVGPAFILGVEMSLDVAESVFIPNCHAITRALAAFFPVVVHDGSITERRFYQNDVDHEHSWLTRIGGDERVIFDPWPLGSLSGPMLTIQGYCFHYGNERSYLDHRDSAEFCSRVKTTTQSVRDMLQKAFPELLAAA